MDKSKWEKSGSLCLYRESWLFLGTNASIVSLFNKLISSIGWPQASGISMRDFFCAVTCWDCASIGGLNVKAICGNGFTCYCWCELWPLDTQPDHLSLLVLCLPPPSHLAWAPPSTTQLCLSSHPQHPLLPKCSRHRFLRDRVKKFFHEFYWKAFVKCVSEVTSADNILNLPLFQIKVSSKSIMCYLTKAMLFISNYLLISYQMITKHVFSHGRIFIGSPRKKLTQAPNKAGS